MSTSPSAPSDVALFLKARAVDCDHVVAEALNEVPGISRKVRAIGWSLVVEQVANPAFFEDLLAFASADSYDEAKRMLVDFAALLDAHVGGT